MMTPPQEAKLLKPWPPPQDGIVQQSQEHQATTKAQTTAAVLTPFLKVSVTSMSMVRSTKKVNLQSFGVPVRVRAIPITQSTAT